MVDIDGTLTKSPLSFPSRGKIGEKIWNALVKLGVASLLLRFSKPNEDGLFWISQLSNYGWKIIVCTGREERFRSVTVDWLNRHCVPFDNISLRPEGLTIPESKARILRDPRVSLYIDDDEEIATEALRLCGREVEFLSVHHGWRQHDLRLTSLTRLLGQPGVSCKNPIVDVPYE